MIISLQHAPNILSDIRHNFKSTVMLSGGFDPIHIGHIRYIQQANLLCLDRDPALLVVVVNGDGFLKRKKGKPFMCLDERCEIVNAIKGVDMVIPYETDNEDTVLEPLSLLRPTVFAKGGDRNSPENIPEYELCKSLGIEVVMGVGGDKVQSSSWLTKGEKC